jgi:dienelactone hydrolase
MALLARELPHIRARPAAEGERMEIPLWFPSDSGIELSALMISPGGWINAPVVVFCRGDAATEADGHDRLIANHLESEGIASLLLDFSTRHVEPTRLTPETLADPIVDLGSAFDLIETQRGVRPGAIGLFGSDVGGTIAFLRAASDVRVRALVLLSAPAPTLDAPTTAVTVPTFVIQGSQDPSIAAETQRLQAWLNGPYELRIVPRGDHHFADATAFARAARDTVQWFVKHLGSGARARAAS